MGAGHIDQWENACLASMRPCSFQHRKKIKIINPIVMLRFHSGCDWS